MLRVPVSQLEKGEVMLDHEASRYVGRVHRRRAGERIVVFDPGRALEAEAEILAVGTAGVACLVGELRASAEVARRALILIQAMAKGDKIDAIVRDATELGATRVIVAETARSVVRLRGERARSRLSRWQRIAREASRQCGRADVPEVTGPLPWSQALGERALADAVKLCPWEEAIDPVGRHLSALGPQQPVDVAVGPEGGLEPGEVELARAAGFSPVTLGPFVLRTETVAAALLGALLLGNC